MRPCKAELVLWLALPWLAWACSPSKSDRNTDNADSKTDFMVADSACPDDPEVDLVYCQFVEIKSLLKAKGSAHDRYRKAVVKCGEFDQVTINFCFGALRVEADRELIEAYAAAKPSPSVAEYAAWKSKIGQICAPDNPPEEGGSGYSSRVTYCNMIKYSEKIDKLSGLRQRG